MLSVLQWACSWAPDEKLLRREFGSDVRDVHEGGSIRDGTQVALGENGVEDG